MNIIATIYIFKFRKFSTQNFIAQVKLVVKVTLVGGLFITMTK